MDLSGVASYASLDSISSLTFANLGEAPVGQPSRRWDSECLFGTRLLTRRRDSYSTPLPNRCLTKNYGPERGRTAGLLNAIEALYQLSYRPNLFQYACSEGTLIADFFLQRSIRRCFSGGELQAQSFAICL